MKRILSSGLFALLATASLVLPGRPALADTGGYPWSTKPSCSEHRCTPDPYGFYYRECTSFVAWKIDQLAPALNFHNNMKGGHFGNAGNWAANARGIGFTVDKKPAVNAVAQIGGHVAMVKSVSTSGKIVVEEYNWGDPGNYGRRTLWASEPDYYIHIADSVAAQEPDGSDEERAADSRTEAEEERPAPAEPPSDLTACTEGSSSSASVQRVIRSVFGAYGDQALRVAACESGPWGTRAANGQYLGLFQMGRAERAKYGHSACAETQASAAYAYFKASGSNWSPWSCKP